MKFTSDDWPKEWVVGPEIRDTVLIRLDRNGRMIPETKEQIEAEQCRILSVRTAAQGAK